jgi:imidazolonepropionase-like amidohydrolase
MPGWIDMHAHIVQRFDRKTGKTPQRGDETPQQMTDEQIRAACSQAHAAGKRAMVHAQGPEGAKAAILAGCNSIEHGNRLTDEVLDLMAQRKA